MIVDPDFLDHWKTQMLIDALGDPLAPIYVLRIWSHCQNRRKTQFKPMANPGLKALCRFAGDADLLAESLEQSGFIRRFDGDGLEVVGWEEKNAQLLAAWGNGRKGGRPKKTQPKPMGNPRLTHGKPVPSSLLYKGFDAFWCAVHLKKGKESAKKAYAGAITRINGDHDDAHQFLRDRMTLFAQSEDAHPSDRSPIHPATWLNSGRYDDDTSTWNGNGAAQKAQIKARANRPIEPLEE